MNQPGPGVEVFVFKGNRFLGSRCFSNNAIIIGRSPRATLKLKDPSVSERHAIVRVEGGKVVVADNDSESGVFVNGARINTRTVSSFDEVSIGPFRIKLGLLGHQQDEDPGFGDESTGGGDEAATQVRAVSGATPSPYVRADAELQNAMNRIGPAAGSSGASGAGQTRQPPHGSHPREAAAEYEADVATRAESPRARGLDESGFEEYAPAGGEFSGRVDEFSGPGGKATKRSGRSEEIARSSAAKPKDAAWPEEDEEPVTAEARAEVQPRADRQPRDDRAQPRDDRAEPAATVEADDYFGDDDDDEDFVEPFSLLENIVRERFKSPADTEAYATIEVIRYKDGQLLNLLRANPGKSIRLDPDNFRLIHVHDDGRAQLFFKRGFSGTVVSNGKARSLKRLRTDKYLVYPRKKIFGVELAEGDYAQMIRDDGGYLVRFVRPPTPPKAPGFGISFNLGTIQMFVGSAAFHLLILVMLGFVAPEADLRVETDAERFAKVSMKDLKLEKPKEEPKKEEPKEEPPPKSETQKPKPVKQPKITRRVRRPGPPAKVSAKQKAQVQRKQAKQVLSALQNLKPAGGPGRSDLKALASNIAAVRVPGGTASDFRVSGVIKKIAGGGVRLAGGIGGGGGKGTKVGSQLLRGGKIGKLVASAGTGSRIRGRVRKAPTRAIKASGGHLSREAIQKVVSQHMHQVQACYERQLITSPGLAGKVVFDWVITPSGSVGNARQVRSSMRSPAVSSCILSLIRRWRFPQPQGGSVTVRYPFVFRVSGF